MGAYFTSNVLNSPVSLYLHLASASAHHQEPSEMNAKCLHLS